MCAKHLTLAKSHEAKIGLEREKRTHHCSNSQSTSEGRKRCLVPTASILLSLLTDPPLLFAKPVLSYLDPWDSGDTSSTYSSRDDAYNPGQGGSSWANPE